MHARRARRNRDRSRYNDPSRGATSSGSGILKRRKVLELKLTGRRNRRATAKDVALAVVRTLGAGGAVGYALEFTGEALGQLSMEERLTLCNMAAEAGATTAIIEPDDTTFAFLYDRGIVNEQRANRAASAANRRYDDFLELDVATVELSIRGNEPFAGNSCWRFGSGNLPRGLLNTWACRLASCFQGWKHLDQVFIGSWTISRFSDSVQCG